MAFNTAAFVVTASTCMLKCIFLGGQVTVKVHPRRSGGTTVCAKYCSQSCTRSVTLVSNLCWAAAVASDLRGPSMSWACRMSWSNVCFSLRKKSWYTTKLDCLWVCHSGESSKLCMQAYPALFDMQGKLRHTWFARSTTQWDWNIASSLDPRLLTPQRPSSGVMRST
jgi:hypothetical protein